MGFMVDKVALGHVFCMNFGISEPIMTPVMLHTRLSSEAGITGPFEATVPRGLDPSTPVTKANRHFKKIKKTPRNS